MVYKRKTWQEKLYKDATVGKVEKIPSRMAKRFGEGTIAIPTPMEVNNLMKKVPRGKVTTINEIREAVAKKYRAKIGCPICCGIFSVIAAHAAEEEYERGVKNITPWWRILKSDGALSEKFPGEGILQKKLLEKEGYKIIKKGKKYFVLGWEKKIKKL